MMELNAPPRLLWAVQSMKIKPTDHVLEVGFGNGVAAKLILDILKTGSYTGIDRSKTALTKAKRTIGDSTPVATLHCSNLNKAKLPLEKFTRIFAFNVNFFWTLPD